MRRGITFNTRYLAAERFAAQGQALRKRFRRDSDAPERGKEL
jgi:hypothetical protein